MATASHWHNLSWNQIRSIESGYCVWMYSYFLQNPIRFSQRNQKPKHNSRDPHVCGSAIHFAYTSANKENLLRWENRDDPIRKPTRKENPNNSIARTERLAKIKTLAAIEQTAAADLRRAAGASVAAIIAHEEHRRSYGVLQSSSARTDWADPAYSVVWEFEFGLAADYNMLAGGSNSHSEGAFAWLTGWRLATWKNILKFW